MKMLFIIIFMSTTVWASEEKEVSVRDASIPVELRSDSVAGNLDGSATFDRVFSTGNNGGSCDYPSLDSGNDGVGYAVFSFYSPSGQMADLSVELGTLGDSLLFIYCGFNPASPADNVVAIDDDGGVGLASAIVPGDGVQLQANTVYYAVVAGFANTDLGTFDLNLGGDLLLGTPEPEIVPTLSTYGVIALLMMMLFLVGFYQKRLIKQK